MSDFKKIHITFSILKLQKIDAYLNGVEFRHKPDGNDVKWPPHLYLLLPTLHLHLIVSNQLVSILDLSGRICIKEEIVCMSNN